LSLVGCNGFVDCRELWAEVVQLFSELAQAWANVGSDDPHISNGCAVGWYISGRWRRK
jgi:hypothetical protein